MTDRGSDQGLIQVRVETLGGEYVGSLRVRSVMEIGDIVTLGDFDRVVADVRICGEEAAIIVVVED